MEDIHQMWLCAKALWPVWLLVTTVGLGGWLYALGYNQEDPSTTTSGPSTLPAVSPAMAHRPENRRAA